MLLLRILALVSFVAAMGFWAMFLRPDFLGGPASYIVVSGASMEPTYYTGDLVITQRLAEYDAGDVVAFETAGGLVIHRIAGGDAEDGYVLQGDNNPGIDPWRPTADEVLGREWVHVPSAGAWATRLREPAPFAGLVGVLGILIFAGNSTRRSRRWRLRRQEQAMTSVVSDVHLTDGGEAARSWPWSDRVLEPAFWTVAVIAVVAVALSAYLALFQSASNTSEVEHLHYEHVGTFGYTVAMAPSALYPEGHVHSLPGSAEPEQAIFPELARQVTFDFNYVFTGNAPLVEAAGTVEVLLDVRTQNGWTRTETLQGPTALGGAEADVSVTVELEPIRQLMATIEEETGRRPSEYDLVMRPRVELNGTAAGQPLEEVYEPSFAITMSDTRFTAPEDAEYRSEHRISETISEPTTVGLGGAEVRMDTASRVAAGVAAPSLALAGLLSAVIFLGVGRDEPARIRARHRSLILDVQGSDDPDAGGRVVRVTAFEDLARIARRDDPAIVFHHENEIGAHRYYVEDGPTTYEYVIAAPAQSLDLVSFHRDHPEQRNG